MHQKNSQFYWMARDGLCTRWPLVITVETVPRIHRVAHHCRRLCRLRRRHPTGRQSQCVIRPIRNIPIRCGNRFGQNRCAIRPTRSIPIPCRNRLGQSQCAIRTSRSIPIRCESRLRYENCLIDEGRPFDAAFQKEASNHFKLLRLRGVVVSVEEKAQ